MIKNKCWFYGDSFTECVALNRGSDYLMYMEINEPPKKWTELFSDKMGLEPIVNAKGGNSSQQILMSVLNDIIKFKKGDWVILTTTPYVRIEGVDFRTKEITTFNNEQILYGQLDLKDGIYGTSHGVPISSSKSKIFLDYLSEFIIPYENEWRSYWQNNMIKISEILKKMGVNVVYWDYSLWRRFTSVFQETNNELKDDHWGIEGNEQFYNFLIENVNNKNYILL